MAKMYPENLDYYTPTKSERIFYEALKKQLPDNYHVFYSVQWTTTLNGKQSTRECDFLVFNSKIGYLTIEVKGGLDVKVENGNWTLILNSAGSDEGETFRRLKESPFRQCLENMYYFKRLYEDESIQTYQGVYGYAVAFPNFTCSGFGCDGPKELIIDYNDMGNLLTRLNELFRYFNAKQGNVFFSQEQRNRFIQIVNKRIALSAAAGALIEAKAKHFAALNHIQDHYLDLLFNYRQVFIVGGAGTGKTWIGIKKAKRLAANGHKVLFVCYGKQLSDFLRTQLPSNVDCFTYEELLYTLVDDAVLNRLKEADPELKNVYDAIDFNKTGKYSAIIVDEAQDLHEEWAITIRSLLTHEQDDYLYVLYDKEQDLFQRDFSDGFLIQYPDFCLRSNIRNTANILKWVVNKTKYGRDSVPNTLDGVEPECVSFKNPAQARIHLENLLRRLTKSENVPTTNIVLLGNRQKEESILRNHNFIGDLEITNTKGISNVNSEEILFRTVGEFKGLEADVVIYINEYYADPDLDSKENQKKLYVAATRARYFLYIIEVKTN